MRASGSTGQAGLGQGPRQGQAGQVRQGRAAYWSRRVMRSLSWSLKRVPTVWLVRVTWAATVRLATCCISPCPLPRITSTRSASKPGHLFQTLLSGATATIGQPLLKVIDLDRVHLATSYKGCRDPTPYCTSILLLLSLSLPTVAAHVLDDSV